MKSNSQNKRKTCSKNHGATDYIEKMKVNDKIFDEKMTNLKQKKIKVIKSSKHKDHKPKITSKYSINKENQLNFEKIKKKNNLSLNEGEKVTYLNQYPNSYSDYLKTKNG